MLVFCRGVLPNKRLHTPRTTDYRHTRQDRWIQTELVSTFAKKATKPNPFEIILLQTTRKVNNWKTEETLETTVVTLETERIKGSNPWCLWWWWSSSLIIGVFQRLPTNADVLIKFPRPADWVIHKLVSLPCPVGRHFHIDLQAQQQILIAYSTCIITGVEPVTRPLPL